jgi:hypothetical protein
VTYTALIGCTNCGAEGEAVLREGTRAEPALRSVECDVCGCRGTVTTAAELERRRQPQSNEIVREVPRLWTPDRR